VTVVLDILAPLAAALAVVTIAGLGRAWFPTALVVALAAAATVTFAGDASRAIDALWGERDEAAKLSDREARLYPAIQADVNVAFFEWARGRMGPGDTYAMVSTPRVEGPVARPWSAHQLLPHRMVESLEQADWLLLYKRDDLGGLEGRFEAPVRFAPGFAIAKAR
jgi:hypothetical protein